MLVFVVQCHDIQLLFSLNFSTHKKSKLNDFVLDQYWSQYACMSLKISPVYIIVKLLKLISYAVQSHFSHIEIVFSKHLREIVSVF